MAYIGFGKCSKYYLYILLIFSCQFICDLFYLYSEDLNKDKENGNKIPNINSYNLNNHHLVLNFILSFAYIICGLIYFIIYKKYEKHKKGEKSILKVNEMKTRYLGEKLPSIKLSIFFIGFFFSLTFVLNTFLESLKLDVKIWSLEIIILILLYQNIVNNNIDFHQKVTLSIFVSILFILQIITLILPLTNHHCTTDECKEKYLSDNNLFQVIYKKYGKTIYIPIILALYIIDLSVRNYSWVKSKYLMDIRSIPIYKILFLTGFMGCILISILFYIVSYIFPCKILFNVNKEGNYVYYEKNETVDFSKYFCLIIDYEEKNKKLYLYYDNFSIFFRNIKNLQNKSIEIVKIFGYLLLRIIFAFSQMAILKNLNPISVIFNFNFNSFIIRLISYIRNGAKEEYLLASQFILLEVTELLAIIANMIYLGMIEIRIWKLDYDSSQSIEIRGINDYKQSLEIIDLEDQSIDEDDIEDKKDESKVNLNN